MIQVIQINCISRVKKQTTEYPQEQELVKETVEVIRYSISRLLQTE